MTISAKSIFAIQSSASVSQGFGTGFVVSTQGRTAWVATSAHVVKDAGGVEAVRIADLPVSSEADGSPNGIDLQVLRVEGLTDVVPLDPGRGALGAVCTIPGFRREAGTLLYSELRGTLTNESGIVGKNGVARVEAWELEIAEGGDGFQPGYSGAPVIEAESGLVLGVVGFSQVSGRKGICIAIDNLARIWRGTPYAASVEGQGERVAALRITLDPWEDRLGKTPEALDALLAGKPLTSRDEPFHALELAMKATLEAGLAVEIYSRRRGAVQFLESAANLWIILLADVALEPERSGPLKWLIKESVRELGKKRAGPDSVVHKVWIHICHTFFSHRSQVLDRIVQVAIEQAEGRNHNRLYIFFDFLFKCLRGDPGSIRRVARLLEQYDDELGNKASPAFLERLKQLIGTGIVMVTHGLDDIPPFRPELVTIPAGRLCDYRFEAMTYPLRDFDYSQIRGVRLGEQPMHPFVFRMVLDDEQTLFNLLSSEVQAVVRLCNQFEKAEDLVWGVPTLCEWLSLAGCEEQPYPWGTEPPMPDRANLFYGGTKKLRPVGSHPLGGSIHGTQDCCGNVHEIVCVRNRLRAEFPQDYRLAGGCYLTSGELGSCHIVRSFRTKREDNRRNVGLRLVRYNRGLASQRESALDRFLDSDHPAAVSTRRRVRYRY